MYILVYLYKGIIISHEAYLRSMSEFLPQSQYINLQNQRRSTYTSHLALGPNLRTIEGENPRDES